MELWVRSQDKMCLAKYDLLILEKQIYDKEEKYMFIADHYKYMGTYTKQRALEILDEISSKIKNSFLIKNEMLLSSKDIKEQLNTFEEALNGSVIIQTPAYDIEPINTNIVYYEMPKE